MPSLPRWFLRVGPQGLGGLKQRSAMSTEKLRTAMPHVTSEYPILKPVLALSSAVGAVAGGMQAVQYTPEGEVVASSLPVAGCGVLAGAVVAPVAVVLAPFVCGGILIGHALFAFQMAMEKK